MNLLCSLFVFLILVVQKQRNQLFERGLQCQKSSDYCEWIQSFSRHIAILFPVQLYFLFHLMLSEVVNER